ncbi:bifunctional diaminohydroxyphosphoribosylaminopyrimidine deaminase/5-amino-6-(5-phosphoribosylamino)uracil reductase RibD [Campylobacter lari]|uniref:Diaminohydroxyphosphoribosylaminopyrimidine deaminase / 5-amino-6-(5-phosphoribosylamino)uracil reductase n=1 Tax=Campylobacter lari (strain RM2100 / D67 / ATCC BAA-1060) TaxID=306263 RepID=B9KEV5_CAMLR|nr:bifunctional diaminohydroxyphosphoribosylaminopyrimidine deaminase/5-amino-6-(5-phosphoribosylamino)uracil reductase RibD [Campylobacter lari]ACM63590.1 diaminohydroxyphosphoribosylaminopyrimidine deaminase / 5-amino-6-(5-phosphoribosylamino)uracil reductase [Campylobacter lari RM2100]EAJ0337357.1 bifunctional diaminohydroxyphosphoribosylaminopyrimidine deaminase/5-amino-6-(5-phosphoribosylamino)uracil reductase RibD [Campylobacter lari]EAK0440005.1 bifunctional diaminohydroxyphosphoribosylam
MNHEFYMNLAIDEAWKYQFLTYPNPAVGCVILDKNGKILSIKAHKEAGKAHAELEAVSKALKELDPNLDLPQDANDLHEFICKNHQGLLKGATAYVSLEPCNHQGKTPPCAKLFSELGFSEVFIAIKDEHKLASGGVEFLKSKGIKVQIGICEKRAKELLKPFLKWQKSSFKIFKLALSLNGSASGKIVSSKASRAYAHALRSKLDLLVVGGETIRHDRPILDARLAQAKAPNLCILSHQNLESFDQKIPLFNVSNRKIFSNIPNEARFIMYEGGENFLKAFKDELDMLLIFSSSNLNTFENVKLDLKLKPLYKGFLENDTYGFYEIIKS